MGDCHHVPLEFPYKISWGDGESPVMGERGNDPVPQG